MNIFEVLFWLGIFTIFYSYVGYGILLFALVKIKRIFNPVTSTSDPDFEPEVSFIVPSYNEAGIIEDKIRNCLSFDYPTEKLNVIFITDGSNDGTPEIASRYKGVTVLHEAKRGGKSAAENRSMKFVNTPVVIFSDANTILPANAIREIVKHYADPAVGAVSGEKRILKKEKDSASGAGEGIYWKYESFLKRMDSELLTIVGAAGELFSFRKELFSDLEEDTILDDFMVSMRIASQGYRVIYEPKAYAMETASESVTEELKRKIRISAGAWQSMVRLSYILNPFKHFTLTFQYISHRVLRWTLAPLFLLILIPLNFLLINNSPLYEVILAGQLFFYALALLGWYLENKQIRIKALFVPYYFFIMNYAVYLGLFRYLKGKQSAVWEKAKRA
ncbi:MAG: glycosyltransferase family 2 protein [Sporocytophaga sp.]|uniref:glycosyltransferase family 2 protein n=1 Tax=Sporocytophaga sp. TaxID=2231183 RepID=UPI001B146003|nr:glycosyltransferase family 2 protein [Sporocytophaga sp.]MBO9700801.1 glycosyltransferase family 2 protein [Sporocytophaga sp.]